MTRVARYLAFSLALLLAVTSTASGALRAGNTAGALVVICTTEGLTQILIGPDGRQITPHPHCPDCVLVDLVDPPGADTGHHHLRTAIGGPVSAYTSPTLFHLAHWHLARSPPALSL